MPLLPLPSLLLLDSWPICGLLLLMRWLHPSHVPHVLSTWPLSYAADEQQRVQRLRWQQQGQHQLAVAWPACPFPCCAASAAHLQLVQLELWGGQEYLLLLLLLLLPCRLRACASCEEAWPAEVHPLLLML